MIDISLADVAILILVGSSLWMSFSHDKLIHTTADSVKKIIEKLEIHNEESGYMYCELSVLKPLIERTRLEKKLKQTLQEVDEIKSKIACQGILDNSKGQTQ